jgi:hypothetical protein
MHTTTMETAETVKTGGSEAPASSTANSDPPAVISRWDSVSSRFLVTPSPLSDTRGEERTTAQLLIVTNIASAYTLEELKSKKEENPYLNGLDFTVVFYSCYILLYASRIILFPSNESLSSSSSTVRRVLK